MAGKRTSAGRKTTNRSRSSSAGRNRNVKSTRTTGRKTAVSSAVTEEEIHAAELRRDILLVLLIAGMVFLFIAELGMAGPVGRVFADIAFGLFGALAYPLPFCIFLLVLFIVSNRSSGTVWIKASALVVLFISAAVAAELMTARMRAEIFEASAVYMQSVQEHTGGGIVGGGLAWMLYHALKMGGTILILLVICAICVILLTQRSITAYLRNRRETYIEEEKTGILERGRQLLAEQRQRSEERRIRRREVEEAEEARRKEERRRRREAAEARREQEMLRASRDPMNLDDLTLGEPDEAEASYDAYAGEEIPEEEDDFGLGYEGSARELVKPVAGPSAQDYEEDEPAEEDTYPLRPGTDELHEIRASKDAAEGPVRRVSISVQPRSTSSGRVVKRFGAGGDFLGGREVTEEEADMPVEAPAFQPDHRRTETPAPVRVTPAMEEDLPDMDFPEPAPRPTPMPAAQPVPAAPAVSVQAAVRTEAAASAVRTPENRPGGTDLAGVPVDRDRGESGPGKTGTVRKPAASKGRKYVFPSTELLPRISGGRNPESDRQLRDTAAELRETLKTFGIDVTITNISQGPSVTRFELQPEQGVKVKKIVSLADDIQMRLAKEFLRIEAPIPGKRAIGIEVSNSEKSMVGLRELLESKEFRNFDGNLAFAVGKDITGRNVVADIARMPHVLIAGATGSGKSVCINTIIISLLYKYSPEEVKMIMIDPKVVELSVYNGIPHLMIPVVTDPRKASAALGWAVAEMSSRYDKFAKLQVRNLKGYNAAVREMQKRGEETEYTLMPRLVVIVDELADLMMVAKQDVEKSICRLAQLARAAGIHLIIATQRPSVDVITGLIKANMPSRIAFAVTSQVDSRTILDIVGAEKLMGKGDMLYHPQDAQKPMRIQGAYVDEDALPAVVEFIRENNAPDADGEDISAAIERIAESGGVPGQGGPDPDGQSAHDEYFVQCGRFVTKNKNATIGRLQRLCSIGFNRAARIMDELAEAGVVSAADGTKGRQVLMSEADFENYINNEM